MCSTCGCGNPNEEIFIGKPEDVHHHSNDKHTHSHGEHTHSHDGHHHSHSTGARVVELEKDILLENNMLAERNRGYFQAKNIVSYNLVSSPGSGKTELLERTIREYKNKKIYVIEGDQQTANDGNRIRSAGVEDVIQINTGKACHLDSQMINKAIKILNPAEDSILFIENVGNLVCPALFDLGESKRVVIISITEGDDKPLKYPNMFDSSDLCIINKIDLLPYLESDIEKIKEYALSINHHLEFIELSAKTGEGIEKWYEYLNNQ